MMRLHVLALPTQTLGAATHTPFLLDLAMLKTMLEKETLAHG